MGDVYERFEVLFKLLGVKKIEFRIYRFFLEKKCLMRVIEIVNEFGISECLVREYVLSFYRKGMFWREFI